MKLLLLLLAKEAQGKPPSTGAFAALSQNAVFADCDVDAADLHLILNPKIEQKNEFKSGHQAIIQNEKCIGCGICLDYCRFGAVAFNENHATYQINPIACEGCGVCVHFCPQQAIDFPEQICGQWYISNTRFGPMVHARLGIAAENSGKFVSLVRSEAKKIALEQSAELILADGPPCIGLSNPQVVVITEPTLSGKHDFERVLKLARHFNIPVFTCINKWDINPELTKQIEKTALHAQAFLLGRISYDPQVTKAQIESKTIIEQNKNPTTNQIKKIWNLLRNKIL
jgi:MinD superfamily P-loop ATPase